MNLLKELNQFNHSVIDYINFVVPDLFFDIDYTLPSLSATSWEYKFVILMEF